LKVQHYFEIHRYLEREKPLNLLYVQLSDSTSAGKVPQFLSVEAEVTGKAAFSANHISLSKMAA